jgi:hypothetical protein
MPPTVSSRKPSRKSTKTRSHGSPVTTVPTPYAVAKAI